MHRLSGQDSGFLSLEFPDQPMHTVTIALLRPAGAEGAQAGAEGAQAGAEGAQAGVAATLEELRDHLARRLHLVPSLRWRIKRVPLGLAHPVAFVDPDFDLGHHLAAVTLPAPGGPDQLDRLVAELAEQHLDRSQPLWRLTLVSGLEDGRQALAFQAHHCLMDGMALFNALSAIFSDEDPAGPPAPTREREPGRLRLLAGAVGTHARTLVRLPGLTRRSLRSYRAGRDHQAQSTVKVPTPGVDTPACSINGPVTRQRRFSTVVLPLADVLAVKRAAGVTVNDVALALCGGAMRRYLEARNDVPDRPLVASVPVGLATHGNARRTSGNEWAIMATSLGTDIAEPWERLLTVSRACKASKELLGVVGRGLLRDWVQVIPPCVGEAGIRRERGQAATHPGKVMFNVTVSNLRGPATPWVLPLPGRRAVVTEAFCTGPPTDGLGVVFVLSDHGDRLAFGITTVAESVDDPRELAGGLRLSLAELLQAARDAQLVATS